MLKLLLTENGLPENAGTCAPRKREATHAPMGVPSNPVPETATDWTMPLGANVMTARPWPDESPFLQDCTLPAIAPSLALASPMLKG